MEQQVIQKKAQQAQRKPNLTGIPIQMKLDLEQRSGLSFDDVRVHYHSDKPSKIGALAYTQGTQVHIGPGQEKHLMHELGHVIQQKRGPIPPTQYISGLPVNCSQALESEADHMAHAVHIGGPTTHRTPSPVIQCQLTLNEKAKKKYMDALRRMMTRCGLTSDGINTLLAQSMGMPKQSGDQRSGSTISTFYLYRIDELVRANRSDDANVNAVIVHTIAMMLAHALGDMSATSQIADYVASHASNGTSSAKKTPLNRAIFRPNPIIMYLNDEINSEDAWKQITRRAPASLPMDQKFDFFHENMDHQMRALLNYLNSVGSRKVLYNSANAGNFRIELLPGLYTQSFVARMLGKDAANLYTDEALQKIAVLQSKAGGVARKKERFDGNPAYNKALRHEQHKHNELYSLTPQVGLMKALAHLKLPTDAIGLDDVITYLSTRKICITRHSSALLEHELNQTTDFFVLRPGTRPLLTSFDALIHTLNMREVPSSASFETRLRALTTGEESSTSSPLSPHELIEYTPQPTGSELTVRGDNYALFRATKNKLFAGKQQAPSAVFGTFLFDETGHEENEYGDVTFTFPPNAFQKCVFTLGDRLRGYTNINDFVRACFLAYAKVCSTPEERAKFLQDETLVSSGEITPNYLNLQIAYPCLALLASALHINTSQIQFIMTCLTSFEIQIFDLVDLSQPDVGVIYRTLSKQGVHNKTKKNELEKRQKEVRKRLPASVKETK